MQDNDVIFIPPRISRVVIEGAVKRPGIYESDKYDNISDLVNYAAGLRNNSNDELLVTYNYVSNDGNNTKSKYISYKDAKEHWFCAYNGSYSQRSYIIDQ